MMNVISKRYGFWWGLIFVILLAISIVPLYTNHKAEKIKKDWQQSRARFQTIQDVWNHALQAENAQRGFLLSGDERYLQTWQSSAMEISVIMQRLKTLTRDYAEMHGEVLALDQLLLEKIAAWKAATEARRREEFSASYHGEELLKRIQGATRQLSLIEERHYSTQRARVGDALTLNMNFISFGGGLSFVLLGFAFLMLRRELSQRKRYEQELVIKQQLLDQDKKRLAAIISTQYDIAISALDVDKTLDVIVSRTQKLTASSGVIVEILDGDALVYRSCLGLPPESLGYRLPMKGSLSGRCVETGEILRTDDAEQDPRVDWNACRRFGIQSMVVVPLRYEANIIGVLKVFSKQKGAFSDNDVETLQLIAGMLASSLAHASEFEAKIKAEEAAQAASRMKSDFLANMSHEIRTPISGVIGMTHLLRGTTLSQQQIELLDDVQRSAEALMTIINDILDFSKVEAGKLELESMDFDLDQVISDVGKAMSYNVKSRNLIFQVATGSHWPYLFKGDQGRLRQILLNLLSNAIKFTEKGGVSLNITQLAERSDAVDVLFEVKDSGIGITADAMGKLFRPFTQEDASTTRRFGGTGLGLSICRALVELMGGRIGVESTLGQGSSFWFMLPLKKGELRSHETPKALEAHPVKTLGRKTILVAEDNTINQKVARGILEKMGFTVIIVATGRDVLPALVQHRCDLILMDCQMPEMDGYEATMELRRSSLACAQSIPIIAMTASAIKGDKERCLAAGMNDYLSKPMKPAELAHMLQKWFDIIAAEEDAHHPPVQKAQ
jgi:signal transduction histidine kinase/CHASE3 domain sensor protein/ActR/RegA family two-component response regulator